jgi:hypothetical protein
MVYWLEKLRDYLIGALGGFLSGVVANAFVQSLVLEILGYQEGWYRQFAPLLIFPIIVLGLYLSILPIAKTRWRFLIGMTLIIPVFLIFVVARYFLPVSHAYSWIEFTALWTMIGQLAGTLLVGTWTMFWLSYQRLDP